MTAERDEASLLLARIAERPADALAVVATQKSPVAFLLKNEQVKKFHLTDLSTVITGCSDYLGPREK